jgi:hypothetical protein
VNRIKMMSYIDGEFQNCDKDYNTKVLLKNESIQVVYKELTELYGHFKQLLDLDVSFVEETGTDWMYHECQPITDDVCSICRENTNADDNKWVQLISCSHKFHEKCIIPHITQHEYCPYCMALIHRSVKRYNSLIPISELYTLFKQVFDSGEMSANIRNVIDCVTTLKCDDYFVNNDDKNVNYKLYQYPKNQQSDIQHIFIDKCCMRTVVNKHIVHYCGTKAQLEHIIKTTWPDRIVVEDNREL